MKKFLKSILSMSIVLFTWLSLCHWAPFWVGWQNPDAQFPFGKDYQKDPKSEISEEVVIKGENSIITRLLDVFNINIDKNSDHKFLDYVKAILNIALGLVSMIALIMTIYTFYLMFFTDNEAWAKKAKWNLVGIFIALAIIGLSWLIVSFIFRWYQEQWQKNQDNIAQQNITMANYESNNQIYFNV